MASNVQVSNRQRAVKFDAKSFAASTQELFEVVLENLKLKPVSSLPVDKIDSLADSAILSVILLNDKEIRKLNKKWRQKDCPTDVLSFPLDLDAGLCGVPFEIGEIIISVETALAQAEEYGHSLEREMVFLFVHGCLHVLGFDHTTPAQEKNMFARQKEILKASGYKP